MPENSVAKRYAVAMIEVAEELGAIEQVGRDLSAFASMVEAHEGMLKAAFVNPAFTVDERRGVLEALLPRLEAHPTTLSFLRLVNDKHRLGLAQAIADSYAHLADAKAGRVRVTVETAEPMTPQIQAEVEAALTRTTGKQVILRTEVVPELIAGLVARVDGKVYDSSLRTRLQNLKQALMTSPATGAA
ncbi:MAG: F-type H+-transporting ATPase subunit delta [Myxococcota bacterium]|jgi:F-type H+-transporting ATPase subunit delta